MVTRATSVPNAINSISSKGAKKPLTTAKPPKPLTRSRSFNNGVRRPSPAKRMVRSTERSKTQEKNAPILIRSRGHEIGSADTLEIVASRSTGSEPSTPEDNINVVVRVRPLCEKEKKGGHGMVLQFPGNGQIVCEGKSPGNNGGPTIKVFTYNVVFEPGATQDDILQYSGIKRLIEMAIEGFSCTAFCYGQTGSGKTHTLTGPPGLFNRKPNPKDERHGLIFRSFVYLFQKLQENKDMHFILKASFLEIYNEKVIDLLNPGSARKPLAVRWSKKLRGFYVENLFTVDCEELDDLLAVLEEGMRNRSVGSHQMNDHSSRSHTILTVSITSEQQAEGGVFISKQGKINFVDLAGSEMTKKTLSEGTTLEEANNINKSLMVLGYCIASLSDHKKRTGHIPYRDSQLTKLLADSLAGNGVTLMIACVSPAYSNYAETLNTLRYASRAKRIRTKPIIIMDPREALILSLKREINALQIENEHLKSALNLQNETLALRALTDSGHDRTVIPEAPKVDLERLAELGASELAELVKLYMVENKSLRSENSELYTTREMVLRDHEVVCRENERLLKKLEDVNSVCVRSPLISARPAILSSSPSIDSNSEVWTNPMQENGSENKSNSVSPDGRFSSNSSNIPEAIQKEMDKRRIGENIINMANTLQRQNLLNRSVIAETSGKGKLNSNSPKDQNVLYMPDMLI